MSAATLGSSTGAETLKRYGAYPVVALAATQLLEAGERQSLAQAFDGIRGAFGASDTALGAIYGAMTLVGVFGGIPIGVLADRVRRTTLLAIAMLVWTLCMGFNAIAPTFLLLFVARLGVGAVEANGPAAMSLMADYYPVNVRARMMGRFQLGAAAGALVGIGLAGVFVDSFGWRAAFWMWIPLGAVVVVMLLLLPEPVRGAQDAAFPHGPSLDNAVPGLDLATPVSYDGMRWREVLRELVGIRSMWYGLLSLTISTFLLQALGAWGIDFFKQHFDLSAKEAGGYAALAGAGSGVGLVLGGTIADRLMARGVLNARVYVSSVSSVLAAFFLVPGWLSNSLAISGACLFVGGFFLTVPVAPSEALVTDVVPGPLRGRAAAFRSVVRALSALAPLVVGVISDATSLPTALAAVTPLYGIGGVVMLLAARTYPADLARVTDRARRALAHSGP